jgi:hypothetical protein
VLPGVPNGVAAFQPPHENLTRREGVFKDTFMYPRIAIVKDVFRSFGITGEQSDQRTSKEKFHGFNLS